MIELPTIHEVRRITQSLATLDLILEPEWEYRYYSFNSRWSSDEEMASMRDGSGDEWFLLMHSSGWAALKGFAHESPAASVEGLSTALQRAVPDGFEAFASEPAFRWDATTFCLWCKQGHDQWEHPTVIDDLETGADTLLGILVSGPDGCRRFVEEYYERKIDLDLIERVFQHHTIDFGLTAALNPEVSLNDIREELAEIGYPH